MTKEKSEEISNWIAKNLARLLLSEQMLCGAAFQEAMEKIEPIYDKYNKSKYEGEIEIQKMMSLALLQGIVSKIQENEEEEGPE